MQENVPASTHTHNAPNLTPTAFVTQASEMHAFACVEQNIGKTRLSIIAPKTVPDKHKKVPVVKHPLCSVITANNT